MVFKKRWHQLATIVHSNGLTITIVIWYLIYMTSRRYFMARLHFINSIWLEHIIKSQSPLKTSRSYVTTYFGLLEFLGMSFWLRNATQTFQRFIRIRFYPHLHRWYLNRTIQRRWTYSTIDSTVPTSVRPSISSQSRQVQARQSGTNVPRLRDHLRED